MSRILQGAKEALAIAKGEVDPKEYAVHSVAVSTERNRTLIDAKSVSNAEAIAVQEEEDSISWREVFDVPEEEMPATMLRGARYREAMTQVQLAAATGIPRRHISEMENSKRIIGKERAKRMAEVLNVDYRVFL